MKLSFIRWVFSLVKKTERVRERHIGGKRDFLNVFGQSFGANLQSDKFKGKG